MRAIRTAFSYVFRRWQYLALAFGASFIIWLLFTVIIQYQFWADIWVFGELSVTARLAIIVSSTGILFSAFSPIITVGTFAVIILSGVQMALLVYYLRRQVGRMRGRALGMWGIIISLFGVGCASCGSVLLTSLFGFAAATATVAALPFHGYEFIVLGLVSQCAAIFIISRRIINPATCRIDSHIPINSHKT